MKKRILLGVDTTLSPATRQALRLVSEFIEQATSPFGLVLLNVIPVPITSSPAGFYHGHPFSLGATPEQHEEAEKALFKARHELQQMGIDPQQIEVMVRVGNPADEIIKTARELEINFIVVGSRGDSLGQKIRRLLAGSISRRVLEVAPCPVMIVVAPPTRTKAKRPGDLVAWYQDAIRSYLREYPKTLTVFTPYEVAHKFVPPHKKAPGRKEMAAATLALEHLASSGVLCAHEVQGELRYVND